MILGIRYQVSNWLLTYVMTSLALLALPFSSTWRKRISACSRIWQNPFWKLSVPLSDLIGEPLDVRIVPLKSYEHNTSELELLALGALSAQISPRMVFEIGTFDGRTTRTLAANIDATGRVYTLNLPPGEAQTAGGEYSIDTSLNLKVKSGCRFLGTSEEAKIIQLYGDSAAFDFTPYYSSAELIFIDGSHSEDYVFQDTETALRLAALSGALVVWHDAPLYGVARCLRRLVGSQSAPLRWIEGTTLMIGWVIDGRFSDIPVPLALARS